MRNGASDRLSRAQEQLDPKEVFDLVEMEVHEELDELVDDPDIGKSIAQDREHILASVKECRQLYRAHPEEYVELMLKSSNEWVVLIGEALLSGDYAALAI